LIKLVHAPVRFVTIHLSVAVVSSVLASAVAATAQTAPVPPRDPQGVFGGIRPDAAATKRLDFMLSLVEGYDDDVPTQLQSTLDPGGLQGGGFSTMLNASAAYAWQTKNMDLGANAGSVIRHYADLGETRSLGHSAGFGLEARLPNETTFLVNQAAAYSPTFLYGLFPTGSTIAPGAPGTTAPDYSVSDFESYSYTTTATLRHDFTRRNSLTGVADYSYTDRLNETAQWRDVSAYSLRGRYAQNVARSTTVSGQFRYRNGQFGYGADGSTTEVGLDFGLEYTKTLSSTRRAALRFNVGASGADVPQVTSTGSVLNRQFLAVGDVGFEYQFNRTWTGRANWRRGLEYVVDLPQPVFADGMSVGADGLLSRRVDILMTAGYSSGESLLNRNSLQFDTYTGNIRLRYALTRTWATYVEYLYYYYDFREGSLLIAGIPSGLKRNGARAGVTLWVPALRR
jgi:hypothetical protein